MECGEVIIHPPPTCHDFPMKILASCLSILKHGAASLQIWYHPSTWTLFEFGILVGFVGGWLVSLVTAKAEWKKTMRKINKVQGEMKPRLRYVAWFHPCLHYIATLTQWKRLSGKSTECKEPWLLHSATLLHCATLLDCYIDSVKKTKRKINGVQGAVIAIGPSLIPPVWLSQASRCYLRPKLQNVTDMADISVWKYWKVGVKVVGDHAVL